MSTLTRKVSSRENHLPISAALARDGGFIAQIGEEFVAVQSGGLGVEIVVERGFLGSARSAHALGSTVTPVQLVVQTDVPTAPPAAQGGGAAQAISLLGPYAIAFDDENLVNPDGQGVVLDTLPDGSLVLAVIAEIATSFDENSIALFERGDSDDWDDTATIFYNDVPLIVSGREFVGGGVTDPTVTDGALANTNVVSTFRHHAFFRAPTLGFGLYISADNPPTQGAANIWVLIATAA